MAYRGRVYQGTIYRRLTGDDNKGYRQDPTPSPVDDTGPKAPRIPRATKGQTTAEAAMNDRIKNGGPLK